MGTDMAIAQYGYRSNKPAGLLNNIFMYTVNMAAKTLVSVAQTTKPADGDTEKWKVTDHLRFMVMLMTWVTVWILRVLMDYFPIITSFPAYDSLTAASFSALGSLDSVLSSASSSLPLALPSSASDLVLYEEVDAPSIQALGRSLTHILALLNEMPATSSKYQFAMTMAERIMDGNARHAHAELLQVNQTALSSAFARTSLLLYRSLRSTQSQDDCPGSWPVRAIIKALPFGSYVVPYVKGLRFCINSVMSWVDAARAVRLPKNNIGFPGQYGEMAAEKLAHELLWITNKLRVYGAAGQALVQWSSSPGLASLALTVDPRVQGLIVKISATLLGDLSQEFIEVTREVKFKLLVLWLPLFCHAGNGLTYPVLTSSEKLDVERTMNEVISSLPAMDQEVILTNWVHDFAVTASDWPNLQPSYDRWCQSARRIVAAYED